MAYLMFYLCSESATKVNIGASVSSILLNPEYEYETSVDENSEPVEGDLDAHGTWDIGE